MHIYIYICISLNAIGVTTAMSEKRVHNHFIAVMAAHFVEFRLRNDLFT